MDTIAKTMRTDLGAAIAAGVVGLVALSVIWVGLVFPPSFNAGASTVLTGTDIHLTEHEWGFNQFSKGGPTICAVAGQTMNITLTNTGQNLHGFQIVASGGSFVAGLAKSDLLAPGTVRVVSIHIDQIGNYHYLCPVSGHSQKGMFANFNVQASC